jgi:hypothetical protein
MAVYAARNSVYVLCGEAFFIINSSTGEIAGSYDYRGTLVDYAFSDDSGNIACAILADDYTAGTTNLIALNGSAKITGVSESYAEKGIEVAEGTAQVEIHNGTVSVLEPNSIVLYSMSNGVLSPQKTQLNEEYSNFIYVNDEVLLLEYNSVGKLSEIAAGEESPDSSDTPDLSDSSETAG